MQWQKASDALHPGSLEQHGDLSDECDQEYGNDDVSDRVTHFHPKELLRFLLFVVVAH